MVTSALVAQIRAPHPDVGPVVSLLLTLVAIGLSSLLCRSRYSLGPLRVSGRGCGHGRQTAGNPSRQVNVRQGQPASGAHCSILWLSTAGRLA
jgi:hypothetical protein